MVYINASKGGVIAFVVFLVAAYFIPTGFNIDGIDIILTISTFLFAIYSGFFMSRLNQRYEDIESYYTSEDAGLISFYEYSQSFGSKFTDKVRKILDEYYITVCDFYDTDNYYKKTATAFFRLYDVLNSIKNSKIAEKPYDDMYSLLGDIESNRNKSSEELSEHTSLGQRSSIVLLGTTIIVSIFLLRTDSVFFLVLSALFSSVVVIIILTLRDLEHLKLGGDPIAQESGQENLEFMGLKRYYNKEQIDNGNVHIPDYVKEYRLGLHKPGAKKFNIKVVKNENYKK